MGSQRNQTADDKVQEGLMDSSKESGKAAEGCYQKVWSYKIRLVYFLLMTAISLSLLIAVIALAVRQPQPGDKTTTMGPTHSPCVTTTNADHCYEIRKQLCVNIEQKSSGCSVCPAGWLPHRESCYYISSGTELTWNESRETCARMGANLTIIEDPEEKKFILKFSKGQDEKLFWIGMRRDGDVWRWEDGQRYDTGLSQLSEESSGDCACLHSDTFYENKCINDNSWICEKRAKKI